ncbi:hypothetical protein ACIQ6V_08760 [Streptomyces sp. NPDC096198]|uniref:hypothetical protein n=1 Tax=Streptomyces sp. NPDC096198 TaxID=3366080 RepID=UPI00382B6F54
MPAPRPAVPRNSPAPVTAAVVVRWAVFTCALVPAVLVWNGIPAPGAISATLGLAAVTWACRTLLRRAEHGAAGAPGTADEGAAERVGRRGSPGPAPRAPLPGSRPPRVLHYAVAAPRTARYEAAVPRAAWRRGAVPGTSWYEGAATGTHGEGRNGGANTPVD